MLWSGRQETGIPLGIKWLLLQIPAGDSVGAGIRSHFILPQSTDGRCFIMLCGESTPCDVIKGHNNLTNTSPSARCSHWLTVTLLFSPLPNMWKAQLLIYFRRNNTWINLMFWRVMFWLFCGAKHCFPMGSGMKNDNLKMGPWKDERQSHTILLLPSLHFLHFEFDMQTFSVISFCFMNASQHLDTNTVQQQKNEFRARV